MPTRAIAAALTLLAAVGPASAATFSVGGFAGNIPIIDVSGQIVEHDDERFALFANSLQFAVVRLDSPGGVIGPAIVMGWTIRDKGYSTYVGPGRVCASACGFIWLAGQSRAKDETAMVGFHGVFAPVGGQFQQTGPGNAVIGAYLDHLHYDMKAIVYMTTPLPDQMAWITPDRAKAVNIAYETRGEVETTLWGKPPVLAPAPLPAIPPSPPQPPIEMQKPIPLVEPAPLAPRIARPKPPPKAVERPRTLQDDFTEFFFGPPPAEQHAVARRPAGTATPTE